MPRVVFVQHAVPRGSSPKHATIPSDTSDASTAEPGTSTADLDDVHLDLGGSMEELAGGSLSGLDDALPKESPRYVPRPAVGARRREPSFSQPPRLAANLKKADPVGGAAPLVPRSARGVRREASFGDVDGDLPSPRAHELPSPRTHEMEEEEEEEGAGAGNAEEIAAQLRIDTMGKLSVEGDGQGGARLRIDATPKLTVSAASGR